MMRSGRGPGRGYLSTASVIAESVIQYLCWQYLFVCRILFLNWISMTNRRRNCCSPARKKEVSDGCSSLRIETMAASSSSKHATIRSTLKVDTCTLVKQKYHHLLMSCGSTMLQSRASLSIDICSSIEEYLDGSDSAFEFNFVV